MFKMILYSAVLSLLVMGCGTENPFDRGQEYDDGSVLTPLGTDGQMSFAANIKPILSKCTSCHAGGTGGWTYNGGEDAYAQALPIINMDTPESSLLLVKGTGNGHGGGVIFTSSSDDYKALLMWIQNGAPDN